MTQPAMADEVSTWGKNTRTYTNPELSASVPSITTVISLGVPKHLERWYAKMAAIAAVEQHDYWADDIAKEIAKLAKEKKWDRQRRADELYDARIKWLSAAADRNKEEAGEAGDAAHDYLEYRMRGLPIPDDVAMLAANFAPVIDRWIETHQPQPIEVEFTVFSETHKYAGTGDLIAYIPGYGVIGIDAKTSRSGIWPEAGLQLSAIENADYIVEKIIKKNRVTYDKRPIPETPGGWYALHLRPICTTEDCPHTKKSPCKGRPEGVADLIEVETGDVTTRGGTFNVFETFLAARHNAQWSRLVAPQVVGPTVPPPMRLPEQPPATFADQVRRGVRFVLDQDNPDAILELEYLWPQGVVGFKTADEEQYTYTHGELHAIRLAVDFVITANGLDDGLDFTWWAKPQASATEQMADHAHFISPTELPDGLSLSDLKPKMLKPAKADQIDGIRERALALPKDLYGAVLAQAQRNNIDRVLELNRGEAKALNWLIETAEAFARNRFETVRYACTGVEPEAQAMIIEQVLGVSLKPRGRKFDKKRDAVLYQAKLTDGVKLQAMCSALASGWLKVGGYNDARAAKIAAKGRLAALETRYGGRGNILTEARRLIPLYDIRGFRPRSADQCAQHPLLCALLLWDFPTENIHGAYSHDKAIEVTTRQLEAFEAKEAEAARKAAEEPELRGDDGDQALALEEEE